MLQLMGTFAQFEREIILKRHKESIKLATVQGKYKGRVKKLSQEQALQLKQDFIDKKYSSKAALGKAYGLIRQTVNKYIVNIQKWS